MRIAILSDIHGNSDAFRKVIEYLKEESHDKIVILGDIVGYGAEPDICLDLARELTDNIVAGNHDYGVAGLTSLDYFNDYAKVAIEWTRKRLHTDHIGFLRGLPLSFNLGGILFLHSSPDEPSEWNYIFDWQFAMLQFKYFGEDVLFVGHTHIPAIWVENGSPLFVVPNETIELDRARRYIINVGSVGQPRDGDSRASFGIFDTDAWSFTNYRIDYDVISAYKKIKDANLPAFLAERLLIGR